MGWRAPASALAALLVAATAHADDIDVFFGPPRTGPDLMERFVEFVDAAAETLDLAAYEIRHPAAVDALIAAKDRGVAVRIVVDDDHYHLHTDDGERLEGFRNPFVQRLERAGIEVRQDDDRSGLMHNKFAIRDGAATWTGSFNLTDTGAARNANNALVLPGAEIAAIYTAEFEEMFVDGLFGIRSPRGADQEAWVGDAHVEVLFGPEDAPGDRTREVLEGAQEEVLFMQFAFTSGDLSDVLLEKKKTLPGFEARGIFDRILHRATGPYGEFAKLSEGGIPVIVQAGTDGKMHHKVFVVDADGEDPVVLVGSANASANANQTNDENLLVIRDRGLARRFRAEFHRMFGELSRARAFMFLEGLPIARRVVPGADIVLLSGGRTFTEIRIELPARWDPEDAPNVAAFRNGRNVSGEIGLEVEDGRVIHIRRPGMAAFGVDAYLKIRLRGLRIPELEGGYALYVTTRNAQGEWQPLKHQPAIDVLPDLAPETLAQVLENLRRQHKRLLAIDRIPERSRARALRNFQACFRQTRAYLVESIREDEMALARHLADFLETLRPSEMDGLRRVAGRTRSVTRALNAAARRGVEGAAELADRLRALLDPDAAD